MGSALCDIPPWGVREPSRLATAVSLFSDPNEDFRSYMEDGHHVADPLLGGSRPKDDCWSLFAVYDGHGGREEVDYCEKKLHEMVAGQLRSLPPGKDAPGALVDAFKKVDSQLAVLGAWNSGCTATVAVVRRQGAGLTLHVANVGDSRAVLVAGAAAGAPARRVSTDHRASDPAETKRVVEEGGIVRHGRVGGQLSVSRSLGDHNLKSMGVSCVPDVCTCALDRIDAGSLLVIASDGLWDALEDDDARQVVQGVLEKAVARGGGQEAVAGYLRDNAAKSLVECAKERGSRDNILALVVFF